jgi:hypothetical protein
MDDVDKEIKMTAQARSTVTEDDKRKLLSALDWDGPIRGSITGQVAVGLGVTCQAARSLWLQVLVAGLITHDLRKQPVITLTVAGREWVACNVPNDEELAESFANARTGAGSVTRPSEERAAESQVPALQSTSPVDSTTLHSGAAVEGTQYVDDAELSLLRHLSHNGPMTDPTGWVLDDVMVELELSQGRAWRLVSGAKAKGLVVTGGRGKKLKALDLTDAGRQAIATVKVAEVVQMPARPGSGLAEDVAVAN